MGLYDGEKLQNRGFSNIMNHETTHNKNDAFWATSRLRLFFLLPLVIAILITSLALSVIIYEVKDEDVHKGVIHINTSAKNFYDTSIHYDIDAMKAIMHTLEGDKSLYTALAKGDREELLRRTTHLFKEIKNAFKITHLYFTGTDRVNLLRVHAPSHYGDVIDRATMHQAQKSGLPTYGVELGPLGTLTLRLVAPWYDHQTGTLVGYVELGMELFYVLEKLEEFLDVQVYTFIKKEFLDREEWESGMRTFGYPSHWDQFPNMVISHERMHNIPPRLVEYFKQAKPMKNNSIIHMAEKNIYYRISILPIHDFSNNSVAEMILLSDITNEIKKSREDLSMVIIIILAIGTILILIFYWLVSRVGNHIKNNKMKLHELATHDGLTGLCNHRTFYRKLEEEIVRANRYKHPVSLLMLDIDHFKIVNDTYGHQAGDTILRDLSKRLTHRMRVTDSVCRYGGEEIMVILTETDISMAEKIAEDLRIMIEQEPFKIDSGKSIDITVSIGVATYPLHAQEISLLVSDADRAMYNAKEGGRNRVCVYQAQGTI